MAQMQTLKKCLGSKMLFQGSKLCFHLAHEHSLRSPLVGIKSSVKTTMHWLCTGNPRRTKISRMYFFILHLSIADILTAFFTILPELIWTFTYPRFYGGNALCKILKFSTTVGPYLSSYTLVMTAFDRYQVRQQTFLTCSAISGAQSASIETNNSIP